MRVLLLGRMAFLLALPLAWSARAEPPAAPGVSAAPDATPPGGVATPPPTPGPASLEVRAGAGFYESVHAGLTFRTGGRHAFGAFVGSNFGLPESNVNTLGLDWRYGLDRPWFGFDAALLARLVAWTSRDDLYAWTLLSAVAGATLSREVGPGLTVALDAGLVRTFTLESDRHQDTTFGSPTPWNVTACVSISQRLAAW